MEKFIKNIFTVLAFASLLFMAGIIIVLFKESFLALKELNLFHFIFGKAWYPTHNPPEFGVLALIAGSLVVSFTAMLVCIPLGLGSALYLHEIAGEKQRKILKPIIEILSSIPSIIFGFFGLVVIAPFLQKTFDLPTGLSVLTAGVVLGVMTIPIICSMTEDALSFVPRSFREASYALGANRFQTLFFVIIPAAASGISTAVILAVSRLMGETMIVLMVAGGAAVMPASLFSPARPMTSTIAAEMGETAAGSLHFSALFLIALILFFITLILNLISERVSKKYRLKLGQGR